jgi:LPPG:FO 2-phospho-L-lactate transferase
MAAALGIRARLLPMSDDRVATMVKTPDGILAFQDYFVRRQHRDPVQGIELDGIDSAAVAPGVVDALQNAGLIIFCPSNPIVSIGPILALPGVRDLLASRPIPRIAVSPIIGGKALKGPADVMLQGLGHESTAAGVARMYQGLLTGMVIDDQDADQAGEITALGMDVLTTDTIMRTLDDRRRLATTILEWCGAPTHRS